MSEKKLEVKIISTASTPQDIPQYADMVILHAITGEMGILPGRLPCSIVLGKGSLRVYNDDQVTPFKIDGGIASVKNNVVTVLSNKIEIAP